MKKIVVWHQGAVGDLILSLPAIYSIKRHGGSRFLHLISRSDLSDIFVSNGIADEVSSHERGLYAGFFSETGLPRGATAFLGQFDEAYVFMRKRDKGFFDTMGRYLPLVCHITTVPLPGGKEHISSFQLRQLAAHGIDPVMPDALDSPHAGACFDGNAAVITIHPGSGGREKRWGLSGFLDLIRILAGVGRYRFFIIVGPAEEEIGEECERFLLDEGVAGEIVAGRPLSFISSVLKSSSLYVGNDSGITHLASALGTPVVAIFGPTDPAVWGPGGERVRILRADFSDYAGGGRLTVEDVLRAACELLNIAPEGMPTGEML